ITADKILNKPESVRLASNKLETFKILDAAGVSIPEYGTQREAAFMFLNEGHNVVVRHTLTGHSGEGIEILKSEGLNRLHDFDTIPKAPLYTKYLKKDQEYRIHVFQGEVFFEQRKARKKEVPADQVNWQIRNHANGFIFA